MEDMERGTRKVDGITYTAFPEQGAWYEDAETPGRVGSLYAPMNADGTMAIDDLGEIEVEYADA
jgi:hypothetical protein